MNALQKKFLDRMLRAEIHVLRELSSSPHAHQEWMRRDIWRQEGRVRLLWGLRQGLRFFE
jgi:hypothetical protein